MRCLWQTFQFGECRLAQMPVGQNGGGGPFGVLRRKLANAARLCRFDPPD